MTKKQRMQNFLYHHHVSSNGRLRELKIRLEAEKVAWSKWHKNCYVKDLISKKETKAV